MEENNIDVLDAIQARDLSQLRRVLTSEKSIEVADDEGRTPLLQSAVLGYEEIVGEILRHSPNLEAQDNGGIRH